MWAYTCAMKYIFLNTLYLLIPKKNLTKGKCYPFYGLEHCVSTYPDLRSAVEMMGLSAGLTCQQKSAVSQVKPAKEITALVPVPSLLPGCFSQTIFL